MSVYQELGVRPFINAGGWMYTRYGGSIMPPEVVAAMAEASRQFVNLYDLQNRVGDAIAAMTHNEAALVSCGAASGIVLAVASCIAGTDAAIADRLPDTRGLKNQVIMSRHQRGTEADPAVRAGGGIIVDVGRNDAAIKADDFIVAFNDQTAAILIIGFECEEVAAAGQITKAAHERGVPVLVDGAYAVPPKENLWHFTRDLGVDAFIISGGKAIRGPQTTGLVLGRRDLIEKCKFHASPNLRVGRSMKVGKEEFAGIYTALKLFLATDFKADLARQVAQIQRIAVALEGIPDLKLAAHGGGLTIKFDTVRFGISAEEAAKRLCDSDPSILLRGRDQAISISASLLQEGEEIIVGQSLRKLLISLGQSSLSC